MSTERNDGGTAFPFTKKASDGSHWHSHGGMSLRDWFAGQALTGLLMRGVSSEPLAVPRLAYEYADAMLSARKQAQP